MRFLVFLVCVGVSIVILKYTEALVRTFGTNDWAEQYLGSGGSYKMWKLIGVGVAIGGILYLFPPAFLTS